MPKVSSFEKHNYRRGRGRENTAIGKKQKFIRIILTFLTVIVVCGLLIKSLILRVDLTAVCDANVKAEQQLAELNEEQRKLQIEYEKSIDLEEIDEYARRELGMQKPSPCQTVGIYTETSDRAVVLDNSETTDNELEKLIGCIKEYFK